MIQENFQLAEEIAINLEQVSTLCISDQQIEAAAKKGRKELLSALRDMSKYFGTQQERAIVISVYKKLFTQN